MTYVVESDVQIPRLGRPSTTDYPLASMEVGDSFELKNSSADELQRARSAVTYYARRNPPVKFAVRISDPATRTYRCWRIA